MSIIRSKNGDGPKRLLGVLWWQQKTQEKMRTFFTFIRIVRVYKNASPDSGLSVPNVVALL